MKKYGDVVIYLRNSVALKALVLQSTMEVDETHTQGLAAGEKPAMVECLLLAYLEPAAASKTIHSVSSTVATAFSVKPLIEGALSGWKEIGFVEAQGSGSDRYTDWTMMGQDRDGFPVPKGSEADVTGYPILFRGGKFDAESTSAYPQGVGSAPIPGILMSDLIALSHRIQTSNADLEISPDAVVKSASVLIDDLLSELARKNQQIAELEASAAKPIDATVAGLGGEANQQSASASEADTQADANQ